MKKSSVETALETVHQSESIIRCLSQHPYSFSPSLSPNVFSEWEVPMRVVVQFYTGCMRTTGKCTKRPSPPPPFCHCYPPPVPPLVPYSETIFSACRGQHSLASVYYDFSLFFFTEKCWSNAIIASGLMS